MKTPRGTHYVIQLMDSFYGGQKPVMRTVRTRVPRELTDKEKKTPNYLRSWKFIYSRWWTDDVQYKKYQPTKEVEQDVPTGKYQPFWVEDINKAKKFRDRAKAESILESLVKEYSLTKIKPVIKIYEGDRNVR